MIASFESCQIFDISPEISADLAVYPGDTSFESNFLMDMKKGDHLSLSTMKTTVHIGAHADAPSHYSTDGQSIEQRKLSLYMGPAQVIEVNVSPKSRIQIKDLKNKPIKAKKILFKTQSFPNPKKWNDDFAALSVELIEYLASKDVELVGIDTPSVDISDAKDLIAHHAIAKYDMAILEGIILNDVNEGPYELLALPLKIKGADASPVRAVLIQ